MMENSKSFMNPFEVRNLLAAIDHNNHIDRDVNTDGTIRYERSLKKKWEMVFKPKETWSTVLYIPEIIMKILKMRLDDRDGMNQPVVLDINDIRHDLLEAAIMDKKCLTGSEVSSLMK